MARYHYRCSKKGCRKRVTLRKPIGEYVVKKFTVCPSCKCNSLKADASVRKQTLRDVCHCDGFPYPHKSKSHSCEFVCKKLTDWDLININLGAKKINGRIKDPF